MARTRYLVAFAAAAALGAVSIGVAWGGGREKPVPAGEQAVAAEGDAFAPGKVILVSWRGKPESAVLLEKARVRRLGETSFLVGRGIDDDTPGNWYAGNTIWVPVEDVGQIVEFADATALKKFSQPEQGRDGL